MNTIIRNILILALVFIHTALGDDILNQYLTMAAENNPGLKSKFLEYQAALERVPQVGSLPDPQVSFGYFIQPVETRVGPQQARLSVMQMFPWFGTLGAQKNVAAQEAKVKYQVFEKSKSKLKSPVLFRVTLIKVQVSENMQEVELNVEGVLVHV